MSAVRQLHCRILFIIAVANMLTVTLPDLLAVRHKYSSAVHGGDSIGRERSEPHQALCTSTTSSLKQNSINQNLFLQRKNQPIWTKCFIYCGAITASKHLSKEGRSSFFKVCSVLQTAS